MHLQKLTSLSLALFLFLVFSCKKDVTPSPYASASVYLSFENNDAKMVGSNYNNVIFGNDRKGNPNAAADFNGLNSYVQIPFDEKYRKDQYSISLWASSRLLPRLGEAMWLLTMGQKFDQFIILTNDYFGNNGWGAGGYDDPVTTISSVYDGVVPKSETWNHVVLTRNGGIIKLYVNGKMAVSKDFGVKKPFYGTAPVIYIGARGTVQPFNGKIDDFALFDKVLTDAEVADIFNY